MRFLNSSRSTLILGNEVIRANSISREYTERELEENYYLKSAISRGRITPVKASDVPQAPAVKPAPDARYIMEDPREDKPVINPKTKTVEYIVADSDSMDSISMEDSSMVIAKDGSGKPPADTIEDGFDARAMKNASEVIEDQLNKDHENATYDDEENLADSEGDVPESKDADVAMAEDFSQIVKSAGKSGAIVTTAKAAIEDAAAKATSEMNKAVGDADEEPMSVNGSGKVVDLMKQPFFTKKKMIAKETDVNVLNEVHRVASSENLKGLVTQRLAELGKNNG